MQHPRLNGAKQADFEEKGAKIPPPRIRAICGKSGFNHRWHREHGLSLRRAVLDKIKLYLLCISIKTTVQKWGNSLAFRIPKAYAEETKIVDGTEVELTLKSGTLVLKPVMRKRFKLADLLKDVTAANRQPSVSTGPAQGKEAW
jgi:antitoxin MazE